MRIISTVPSITELLYDLSLDKEVVGITKFCVHPEDWYRNKTRIGGTKTLKIDKIRELKPDLIIANKEENTREQIEELSHSYRVFVSDIKTVEDNVGLIEEIGRLTDRIEIAASLSNLMQKAILKLNKCKPKTAVYLIWQNPLMTIGGDTYIHNVMKHCRITNLFGEKTRYPVTDIDKIKSLNPELLLLSSEPFPFKDKHVDFFRKHLINTQVKLVDGEAFSWYGTRLIKCVDYLTTVSG